MENEAQDDTAPTSHYGQYRFVRMPFGSQNVPSKLQRRIDAALAAVTWHFLRVPVGEMVVFFRFFAEEIDDVKQVLTLLRNAEGTLKLKKFNFFTKTVD